MSESATKWLPSEYMDEVGPPARLSPNDWIEKLVDGAFCLGSADLYDEDEKGRRLIEGEIIKFSWTQTLGTAELFVNADGTYRLEGEEPAEPDGAYLSIWIPGDHDSVCVELSEIAKYISASGQTTDTIEFYCWSQEVAFKFLVGAFHKIDA